MAGTSKKQSRRANNEHYGSNEQAEDVFDLVTQDAVNNSNTYVKRRKGKILIGMFVSCACIIGLLLTYLFYNNANINIWDKLPISLGLEASTDFVIANQTSMATPSFEEAIAEYHPNTLEYDVSKVTPGYDNSSLVPAYTQVNDVSIVTIGYDSGNTVVVNETSKGTLGYDSSSLVPVHTQANDVSIATVGYDSSSLVPVHTQANDISIATVGYDSGNTVVVNETSKGTPGHSNTNPMSTTTLVNNVSTTTAGYNSNTTPQSKKTPSYLIRCNTATNYPIAAQKTKKRLLIPKKLLTTVENQKPVEMFPFSDLDRRAYKKIMKLTLFLEYALMQSETELTTELLKKHGRGVFNWLHPQVLESDKMYKIDIERTPHILFGIHMKDLARNANRLIRYNINSPYIAQNDIIFQRSSIVGQSQLNPLRWHVGEYLEISLANPELVLTIPAVKKALLHVLLGVIDAHNVSHYHPLINEHTVRGSYNSTRNDIQFKLLNIGWIKADPTDSRTKRKMARLSIKAMGSLAEYVIRNTYGQLHCADQGQYKSNAMENEKDRVIVDDFIMNCKDWGLRRNPFEAFEKLKKILQGENYENVEPDSLFRSRSRQSVKDLLIN